MTVSKTDNKKLESLKRQLLGKSSQVASYAFSPSPKLTNSSDLSFLKKDLLRILVLITLALTIELSLSWAIHQGLLIQIGLR